MHSELHYYTMMEDQATGAKHIVETVHWFVEARHLRGQVSKQQLVELDSRSRENGNNHHMFYVEYLVAV